MAGGLSLQVPLREVWDRAVASEKSGNGDRRRQAPTCVDLGAYITFRSSREGVDDLVRPFDEAHPTTQEDLIGLSVLANRETRSADPRNDSK